MFHSYEDLLGASLVFAPLMVGFVMVAYDNHKKILGLFALAVGADVTWSEVVLALALAVVAWFGLVLVLSI